MPDLFERIGFGNHLGRHFRAAFYVESEKVRVDDVDERVVDLEVADAVDTALFELFRRPAAAHSAQASAVPVGGHGDFALLFEDYFAVGVNGGHEPLLEEDNVVLSSPKKAFSSKNARVAASFIWLVITSHGIDTPYLRCAERIFRRRFERGSFALRARLCRGPWAR